MKILAIDCSAGPASCALTEKDKLLGQFFIDVKLTHSQTLMPMVESLLKSVMIPISEVDAFAISNGPGSFTGIRIGVGAVKGMAEPMQKKCIGVSTLEAIARIHGGDKILCAVMDARCNQVYNALFDLNGFTRLCDDRAISIDDLAAELTKLHNEYPNKEIVLAGDGAELVYNTLNYEFLKLASKPNHCQTAYGVALAAFETLKNGGGVDAAELMPTYLRLPQAERELKKRRENECNL